MGWKEKSKWDDTRTMKVSGLFDLSHTIASEYLARFTYPWEAPASSARRPKCVMVRLSAAPRWWGRTAWWGIPLNPGTVIGRNTSVYPLSSVRGVVPASSIVKTGGIVVERQ